MRFRIWLENEDQYWYHETKKEHIQDIAAEGLQPMSYGQSFVGDDPTSLMTPDMFEPEELEEFPEEDLVPRTYLLPYEPNQMNYGDYLLRFPRSAVTDLGKDDVTGEPVAYNTIPASMIEIHHEKNWLPVQMMGNPKRSIQWDSGDPLESPELQDGSFGGYKGPMSQAPKADSGPQKVPQRRFKSNMRPEDEEQEPPRRPGNTDTTVGRQRRPSGVNM